MRLASSSGRLAYLDWLRFLVVLSLAPFHAALSFTGMGVVYVYDTPIRDLLLPASPPRGGPRHSGCSPSSWTIGSCTCFSSYPALPPHRLFQEGQPAVPWRTGQSAASSPAPGHAFCHFHSSMAAGAFLRQVFRQLHFFLSSFLQRNQPWPNGQGQFRLRPALVPALPVRLLGSHSAPAQLRETARTPRGSWPERVGCRRALLSSSPRSGLRSWRPCSVPVARFPEPRERLGRTSASTSRSSFSDSLQRARGSSWKRWSETGCPPLPWVCSHSPPGSAVYRLTPVPAGYSVANIAAQALRGAAAYGLVSAALGYGRRFLNHESRALDMARDLAFPLYVLHFAPLSAATYLLLGTGLSVLARWMIAVLASWATVALFTYLARFVPLVRDLFGIRPPGAACLLAPGLLSLSRRAGSRARPPAPVSSPGSPARNFCWNPPGKLLS